MRPAERKPPELAHDALFEAPGTELRLGDYLDVIRRRWRLAAAVAVVCAFGGAVHYSITPKMFQATTTIQIDRRSLSIGGSSDSPWLENWWNMEFYPTQYKLLESRGLAERVVTDLRLYEDPVFNPGWASWGDGERPATPELDHAQLGGLGLRLLGGLEVAPIKGTQLVQIHYRSGSPELAARIANGVADAFIDWGIETRSESVGKASSFLGRQIEELKQELADKEATLQAYGRRSDIVAIEPQTNPTLQQLESLNQRYVETKALRIEKEAAYNEVLSAPAETIADPLSGGLVSQLRTDLRRLEQEYATKSNTYKPEMPVMAELRGEIDTTREHLRKVVAEMVEQARQKARAEYQTIRRQEDALASELERAREEANSLGSASVQYHNLRMEVETRRQLLDDLLKRQSETEVTARLQATRESNVRIVDRALVPGGPYSPSLRRDLGMALGFGLFLGIACIFLLEYLDRSLKTAEEAERTLGLPVLAVIPDVVDGGGRYRYGNGHTYAYGIKRRPRKRPRDRKGAEELKDIELLPHVRPRHAISEAYRSLRTALLLSSAEQLRLIALTSAQSGEGKTATASNLAVVMAQLGRQVLLIDADLRKPRLHRVFSLSNREGLVHCLTGAEPLEQVVQSTGIPGLHVLPSGTIPPNPSELLASDRMRELLLAAQRRFDFVIVDTPPLLAVTDAALVGAMADGIVFTLHAGRVLRDEAKVSVDRLRQSGVRVLGTVLNRYLPGKAADGKHYYYYQYQTYGDQEERTGDSAA